MSTFVHSGATGDMIFSLPTIRAMGGGKLIIDNGDTKEEVLPIKYNFTILDFTENDINHSVEVVKNNFRRFTYIDFVYNESEYKAWEKTKKI
jgi:hypothetical protein